MSNTKNDKREDFINSLITSAGYINKKYPAKDFSKPDNMSTRKYKECVKGNVSSEIPGRDQ